ncbi:MAG TPA: hypothetical protein VFJ47_16355, partial [Terriglobales bacterium]|nr:hypothetical protein [Terriglobales bacterium]
FDRRRIFVMHGCSAMRFTLRRNSKKYEKRNGLKNSAETLAEDIALTVWRCQAAIGGEEMTQKTAAIEQ